MEQYTILHLEDDPKDAELVYETLQDCEFEAQVDWIQNKADLKAKLKKNYYDVVLADFSLPDIQGEEALELVQTYQPDTPFVIVSGAIADMRAIELLKAGATDYVLKDKLIQLPSVVSRVIDQAKIKHERRMQRQFQNELLTALQAGLFKANTDGQLTYVNHVLCEITERSKDELLAQNWLSLIHEDDNTKIQAYWQKALKHPHKFHLEFRLRIDHENIKWITLYTTPQYDRQERFTGYIGTVTDITYIKEAEAKINKLARYDSLTGLANRRLFLETLDNAIESTAPIIETLALFYIDINEFKKINDSLGYEIGDLLLQEVALRLKQNTNSDDFVAHLGSDQFALLIYQDMDNEQLVSRAQRLLAKFRQPFYIKNNEIHITLSIGIVIYPEGGKDQHHLTLHAEQALDQVKSESRDSFGFYQNYLHDHFARVLNIEKQLRYAIDCNELYVVYQPQFDINSNHLNGAEALLRWHNNNLGNIQPYEFIPIAENNGLIETIGLWVYEQVVQQLHQWLDKYYSYFGNQITVSINLSPHQLKSKRIVKDIQSIAKKHNVAPHHITLELTETAILQSPISTIPKIQELHKSGFKIALDDFGTGYSSLTYLKNLPLDIVKIDMSFIKEIHRDAYSYSIVKGMIFLAHALNLDVVSEGVETQEQLNILRELQSDALQGFLYAKPLKPDQLIEYIETHDL